MSPDNKYKLINPELLSSLKRLRNVVIMTAVACFVVGATAAIVIVAHLAPNVASQIHPKLVADKVVFYFGLGLLLFSGWCLYVTVKRSIRIRQAFATMEKQSFFIQLEEINSSDSTSYNAYLYKTAEDEAPIWTMGIWDMPKEATNKMFDERVATYAIIHPKSKTPMAILTDKEKYLLSLGACNNKLKKEYKVTRHC